MKNLILLIVFVLVSCGSNSGPDRENKIANEDLTPKQRSFLEEYTNSGSSTAADPIIVKTETDQGGEWIIVRAYYRPENFGPGTYASANIAFNLAHYTPGNIAPFIDGFIGNGNTPTLINGEGTLDDLTFLHVEDYNFTTDPVTGERTRNNEYDGLIIFHNLDSNGEYIGETSESYHFEESNSDSKDLEKVGSNIEKVEIEKLKSNLLDYGFSESRSASVSKLYHSLKKVSSKRALNLKEKNMASQLLLGMPFEKAANEMVQDYDDFISKAAEANDVSPEAISEVLNNMNL